jgi:predicted transcriptional regulator
MAKSEDSTVLTLRISRRLDRRIEREARRRRSTKSAVLREALQGAFGESPPLDLAREARRQSLLVSGRDSEREVLEFIEQSAAAPSRPS